MYVDTHRRLGDTLSLEVIPCIVNRTGRISDTVDATADQPSSLKLYAVVHHTAIAADATHRQRQSVLTFLDQSGIEIDDFITVMPGLSSTHRYWYR